VVAATIAAGQAASPQVVRNTRRMVAGDHGTDVVFSGHLRRKDAAYGVRLAETLGVGAPFGRAALAGLDALVAAGLGDQNESSIIEVARRAR
jgi:3-hydroxyisobutyrate dehydrogenase